MPTPVGPVPPDPDDPDTWDWGEFADGGTQRKAWQRVVVGVVVAGLVLLLIVNIL